MLIKSRSIESISKFSAVCMLTFAMFLCPNLDSATARDLESRTQAVDNLTDWFFYKVNPQLGDRKLRSDDSPIYIREWNAIRRTVDRATRSLHPEIAPVMLSGTSTIVLTGDRSLAEPAPTGATPTKRIALQIQFGLSAIHPVTKLAQMFLNNNGKSFGN
ncbi:hypothetical protein [Microcoleus sp. herbarium12]|uniref:hypothetical protein n=1 Tax=Microcoleus sp. herbarium12 TaxID=3055437 RepID=UPI002FD2FFE7